MRSGSKLQRRTDVDGPLDRTWAEAKIKQLTGGDEVSARFMRQDFFQYVPQFKLHIAGNNKPKLKSVDVAIRRRMNLLPFTVLITEEERDKDFAKKLESEWPGILAQMVQGCLEWQRFGLAQPQVVLDSTEEYFEEEDAVSRWVRELCLAAPTFLYRHLRTALRSQS
jgi:putative DNA primase/helicase